MWLSSYRCTWTAPRTLGYFQNSKKDEFTLEIPEYIFQPTGTIFIEFMVTLDGTVDGTFPSILGEIRTIILLAARWRTLSKVNKNLIWRGILEIGRSAESSSAVPRRIFAMCRAIFTAACVLMGNSCDFMCQVVITLLYLYLSACVYIRLFLSLFVCVSVRYVLYVWVDV